MYWFVGLGGKNEYGEQLFKIEDDTDGVVEELTKDDIEWYVRHGLFIKYREGAIEESGKYIGKRFKTDYFDVIPLCKIRSDYFCFLDELGIITKRASTDINKSTKSHSYVKNCFTRLWVNNQGDRYKVLYVKNSKNVHIEFIDYKTTTWTTYPQIEKGEVTDGLVYHFGISDIYGGHYLYGTWYGMISRCKNPKDIGYSSYGAIGVDIDESFRRASDFVKWYESQPNYKALVDAEVIIYIDKDLAGKKLYGKDTCYLLPPPINDSFLKERKYKNDLPVFCNNSDSYIKVGYCTLSPRSYVTELDQIYSDEYYYDLMMQFFNSRDIEPQWNYDYLVKIGRKWVIAKNCFEEFWYKELKDELEKGWITQEIYDLLLPMVECHITD